MMSNQGSGAGVQRVQTDAICAACGTVNPEGTIQCVSCGNNLAEQHRLRLAQQGAPVLVESGVNLRVIISGTLMVFGLLLVVFVALNANQIENLLVSAQSNEGPARLWYGTEAAVFSDLSLQLANALPKDEEVVAALDAPQAIGDLTGRYALVAGEDAAHVGCAIVKQEGEFVYFVGRANQGGEIRGVFAAPAAGGNTNNIAVRWEDAGLQIEGTLYACAGAALINENGFVGCFGQTEKDTNNYEFNAYKLP